jgi:hypothetical protein
MSELSPLSGVERKSNFEAVRSVDDPERTSGRGSWADCLPVLARRPTTKC